jgi:hypothetical protein
MLGYFNTVKELAGMITTFKDEIISRLNMIDPNATFDHDLIIEELTSRKKAQEIHNYCQWKDDEEDDIRW